MTNQQNLGNSSIARIYRDMVQVQLNLREMEADRYSMCHKWVMDLANKLVPDWLETRSISSRKEIEPEELIPVINQRLSTLMIIKDGPEREQLLDGLLAAEDKIRTMGREIFRLKRELETVKQSQTPPTTRSRRSVRVSYDE